MSAFQIEPAANAALDDIYDYARAIWGADKAAGYIEGLFAEFAAISDGRALSRPIPFDVGGEGFVRRWESHFIYWKRIGERIAIVAILHERQAQEPRIAGLFDLDG